MKLSEAIMLGDIAVPRNDNSTWFGKQPPNYEECGCAIGRAWLVSGRTRAEYMHEWEQRIFTTSGFESEWPWVGSREAGVISQYYQQVLTGYITFEELVEYVKKIEPECGVCNRHQCSCVKVTEATEAKEEVLCEIK